MKLSRREFIAMCAKASGSAITLASLNAFANNHPSIQPNRSLTTEQQQILHLVIDHIFPETETPGAISAGVLDFVSMMYHEWLNEEEATLFIEGMNELNTLSHVKFKHAFSEISAAQQLKVLEALEDNYADHPWYGIGSTIEHLQTFIESPPFICQIKELSTFGFFMSKIGSTEVLRPFRMGELIVDLPLEPNDSAWAFSPFS